MSFSSLWVVLISALALWLLYNLVFIFFHEKLIFQGGELANDHDFDFNFPYEEIKLKPSTDVQLHGVLLKSESSKGIIIYFHGNRGTIERWGKIGHGIRSKYDYDVLVMDYRGYGKSRGERSEVNIYEDAEYVYDHVKSNFNYDQIIIQGRSLGTAIATHLATQRRAQHLILETPMTRIRDIIPWLDFLLIHKSFLTYELNSLDRINKIPCPITIIHGTDDGVVPYDLGYRLYVEIGHSKKKFITINHGKHNNLDTFDSYQQALERILE